VTPCASCKCATNCANGPSPLTLPPGHIPDDHSSRTDRAGNPYDAGAYPAQVVLTEDEGVEMVSGPPQGMS
jgi:hypothetical protein